MTDEIYQGIHQVREENHQKVEGAVTDEDVYGWGHPRIFDILPGPPQRQNEDARVGNQWGNPKRGFKQFLSFSLKGRLLRIDTHERLSYRPSICSLGQVSREVRPSDESRHYLQGWEAVGLLS